MGELDDESRFRERESLKNMKENVDSDFVSSAPLKPWMRVVLRAGAICNVWAGLTMIVFYDAAYRSLGFESPQIPLHFQLVGTFVLLLGIGYWRTASHPMENRNLLLFGTTFKAIGIVFALWYVVNGYLRLGNPE